MELISSNNNITAATPKMVETPLHFSLNTQLYDKLTLNPLPMKYFTRPIGKLLSLYNSVERSMPILERALYAISEMILSSDNIPNIIQDKNNPNIFYSIRPHVVYAEDHIIEKTIYNPDTMEYTVSNSILCSSFNSYTKNFAKLIYEDSNNLLIHIGGRSAGSSNSVGSYSSHLLLIDKNNFGYIALAGPSPDYQFFALEEDNGNLYLLKLSAPNTGPLNSITKLNTYTKQYTTIYSFTADNPNTYAKRILCTPIKINGSYYTLYSSLENNSYFYKMRKITINTADDTVQYEDLALNLNGYVIDESGALNYSQWLYHNLRILHQTEDVIYLSLTITVSGSASDVNIIKQCKHMIIEVKEDTFKIIDSIPITEGCYGSLVYNDNKHLILLNANSVSFYQFDEREITMKLSHRRSGIYVQLGLDSLNRVVTMTSDGAIEIITEGNASLLKVDFSKDIYNKDKLNKETSLSFYAKNFLDEFIDTSVKITLIGPVMFKDNESREIIISTSSDGPKNIPVIITGIGTIEAIITQNT